MGEDNWRIENALKDPARARALLGQLTDEIISIEQQIRDYRHRVHLGTASHQQHSWYIRATTSHQLAVDDCKRLREYLRTVRDDEHTERAKPRMTERSARQIAHAAITYRFRMLDFQSDAWNTSRQEVDNARAKLFKIIDKYSTRAE